VVVSSQICCVDCHLTRRVAVIHQHPPVNPNFSRLFPITISSLLIGHLPPYFQITIHDSPDCHIPVDPRLTVPGAQTLLLVLSPVNPCQTPSSQGPEPLRASLNGFLPLRSWAPGFGLGFGFGSGHETLILKPRVQQVPCARVTVCPSPLFLFSLIDDDVLRSIPSLTVSLFLPSSCHSLDFVVSIYLAFHLLVELKDTAGRLRPFSFQLPRTLLSDPTTTCFDLDDRHDDFQPLQHPFRAAHHITTLSVSHQIFTYYSTDPSPAHLTHVLAQKPPASTFVHGGGLHNLTVSINVPNNSSDALFFHFNGPATSSWVAFGFGDSMSDALMFVAYEADNRTGVTLSPRLGDGHVMPEHTDSVKITILPGSGVENNVFSVNAMCGGCRSWNGGSIDLKSTSQNMIWAIGPAWSLASDDLNAPIRQHQLYGTFALSMVAATGTAGVPLVSAPGSVTTSPGSDGDDDDYNGSGPRGWNAPSKVVAHALLMIAAFLILFPGGYLTLRVFEKVPIHAGIQSVAMLFVIISTALGVSISKGMKIVSPSHRTPRSITDISCVASRPDTSPPNPRLPHPRSCACNMGNRRRRAHGVPQDWRLSQIHDWAPCSRTLDCLSRSCKRMRGLLLRRQQSTDHRVHRCYDFDGNFRVCGGVAGEEAENEEGRNEHACCDEFPRRAGARRCKPTASLSSGYWSVDWRTCNSVADISAAGRCISVAGKWWTSETSAQAVRSRDVWTRNGVYWMTERLHIWKPVSTLSNS
jgi:Cytochrome domain of cellobiose dehydrogenase